MVYNSTIKNNNWNIELVQKFVIYFTINLIKNHFSKNRFKKSPITEYKKLRLIHSKFLRLFWCITLQNVSNPLFLGIYPVSKVRFLLAFCKRNMEVIALKIISFPEQVKQMYLITNLIRLIHANGQSFVFKLLDDYTCRYSLINEICLYGPYIYREQNVSNSLV